MSFEEVIVILSNVLNRNFHRILKYGLRKFSGGAGKSHIETKIPRFLISLYM